MSEAMQAKRENALDFLDELDGKHDRLLDELDLLNTRIDSILADYAKSRQAAANTQAATTQAISELGTDLQAVEPPAVR